VEEWSVTGGGHFHEKLTRTKKSLTSNRNQRSTTAPRGMKKGGRWKGRKRKKSNGPNHWGGIAWGEETSIEVKEKAQGSVYNSRHGTAGSLTIFSNYGGRDLKRAGNDTRKKPGRI